MKTRNNVQKAITKTMAVIMSLVLISITVNAQEFWKTVLKNNSFSQIAYAMSEQRTGAAATTETLVADYTELGSLFVAEAEPSLQLEDWMTDASRFTPMMAIVPETENALELEDWMMNESLFSSTAGMLTVEAEPALQVESWMTDASRFDVRNLKVETEVEPKLKVENWMTNNLAWKF
ncbi:hypothetical protein [Maribellus sp. YY47]|uniref:hypothetical protein n=1 Tax=Maribellus sp. YY47 TaxID=2929486 RepID=UPI0020017FB0|nr:hypothetical protein [Maribellus sp. YY47]MCK3685764.1 hypothetical protein [Maribellus sp. YY47]